LDSSPRPFPADQPGRAATRTPILAGRDRERQRLGELLEATLSGRGGLVLVGGEAGIGKTALAADLANRAEAAGVGVVWGRCYDLSATPPHGPWREIVTAPAVQARLPGLTETLSGTAGGAGESGHDELAVRIRDGLFALASERPLLLVLDDLHWVDPASLVTLRTVARSLSERPLLVVAIYRADEVTRRHPLYRLVPLLVREAGADRLDLRSLDDHAVGELIATHSLTPSDRARLVAYLQTNAEGNPFFLLELLRALEEEGILRPGQQGWVFDDPGRLSVPPLLRQVIDGRLDRLGEETRDHLALAAVVGQEVPVALWTTVAGLTEDEALVIVEPAVEAHLLEATPDGSNIRFAHALIREALYEGVSPLRRRGWHRRIAEALMAEPAPDPDAIAYHLQRAGDERALDWLVRAGERAQRAYAWTTAVERFEAAIALAEGDDSRARDRAWLLCRAGRLLRFTETRRGISYIDEAGRIAEGLGDRLLSVFALADGGWLRSLDGQYRRGLAELAAGIDAIEAIAVTGGEADAALLINVAHAVPIEDLDEALRTRRSLTAVLLALVGRFGEAAALAESCLSQPEEEEPVTARPRLGDTDSYLALGLVHSAAGRIAAARPAFLAARDAARTGDHYIMVGFTAYRELRDVVLPFLTTEIAARRWLAAEVDERMGQASGALIGTSRRLSFCLLLQEAAWHEARSGAQTARLGGTSVFRGEAILTLAWLAFHQGTPDLARGYVGELLPDGPATEPGAISFPFLDAHEAQRIAADVEIAAGNLDLARAWLEAHDRWLDWSGSVRGRSEGRLGWARLHATAGETAAARHEASEALVLASDPRQPIALLAAHRLLGEIEIGAGRHAVAEDHLTTALRLAEDCALPFERALTLFALAELRAAAGRGDDALALLAAVRDVCEPIGATPTIARAADLAGRLTARVAAPSYPAGLSVREVEVLRLVAQGLTDAEVADRLSISPRTVGQHLRSVYNKLGVSSRTAATRLSVEYGLT
jgi:ATP/maltotriose-dependent transcriptional regulator MalT